jgi:hypothetical protein
MGLFPGSMWCWDPWIILFNSMLSLMLSMFMPGEKIKLFLCQLLLKHLFRESLVVWKVLTSLRTNEDTLGEGKFQLSRIIGSLSGQLTKERPGLDAELGTFYFYISEFIIPANPQRHVWLPGMLGWGSMPPGAEHVKY